MPYLVLSKGLPFCDVSIFFSLRRRIFFLPSLSLSWRLERQIVALGRSVKLALSLGSYLLCLRE